jgi:hypothetical protein
LAERPAAASAAGQPMLFRTDANSRRTSGGGETAASAVTGKPL